MEIEAQNPARQPQRGWRYAEQGLYDASPLGLLGTTAALLVILLGLYAAAAALDHRPWIVAGRAGPGIDRLAWVAICLSLIVCAALGLQRFSQLADMKDAPMFARDLPSGFSWFPTFSKARLRLSTALGAAVGGGGMLGFLASGADGSGAVGSAVGVWSVTVAAVLGVMFFRGVELTRAGAQHSREVLRAGITVDLLRIERLYPFGRAAARTAIIWFAVSAGTLLLLVGTSLGPAMAALAAACAAMGGWVFLGTLGQIRRAIRAAKAAELEQVRRQLIELKGRLHTDPTAPAKLQSLLAYEARIAAVHEWPFDQTTLVRVAASSLVLAVPWFGQAFAGALVERFSALIR